MASSFSLAQLVVARVVLGVGTGGYLATVPVWQSEMSKPARRGAHVVTDGIFLGAGASAALWIDLGFYFVKTSSISWRFPLGVQTALLLTMMVFVCVLPESPRWLVKQGRQGEARQVLAALNDTAPDDDRIAQDIGDIELSLSVCGTLSWKAMLSNGPQRMLHRTVLAAAGQMFQQMCGINLISMYATTIFEQYLGLSPVKSRILAAAMCMTQLFGGSLAFFTIDRLGRRVLMLSSAAGMAFIFTVGYAGLTFLYATEVAPLQLRAAISAVSTAAVWIFNFLLAEVTPIGFNTIGYRYYIVFAVLNAAIVPSVYFFFPETSGRSLEEIDEIFFRSKSIWDPPRVAQSLPRTHAGGEESEESASSSDVKAGGEHT
ncbi:General substrate transporter, partial [Metarhizium majus ARSEF 297]